MITIDFFKLAFIPTSTFLHNRRDQSIVFNESKLSFVCFLIIFYLITQSNRFNL